MFKRSTALAEHRGPARVSRLASAASLALHIQRLIYQLLGDQLAKNIQSYSQSTALALPWHGDGRQSYDRRISGKVRPLSARNHADGKPGEVSQSLSPAAFS